MAKYTSASIVLALALLMLFQQVNPAGATATPTPTATPTLTNDERLQISTPIPPRTCGDAFTPCGSMPWLLIDFPTLSIPSPTQIDIFADVGDGTATRTPTPTPTGISIDTNPINTMQAGIGGISATVMAQTTQQFIVNGTPVGIAETASDFGSGVGSVFGYAKGLSLLNFWGTGGIITAAFIAIAFIIMVRVVLLVVGILLPLFRLILQVIEAVTP